MMEKRPSLCSEIIYLPIGILADFYFFDASGTEISHCQNIEIPLKRNHETVLRGFFLTRKIGDGNNVNIDDNFGGEYVVEIN